MLRSLVEAATSGALGPAGADAYGYDAVILAGGRSRRLGGLHKPALAIEGVPLVQRVVDAVGDAGRVVVVGPAHAVPDHVIVTREEPAGSGPVPALAAGLARVRAGWVALLAADLPFLRHADITALLEGGRGGSGAVLVDTDGRKQWLAGVWRVSTLRPALAAYGGTSLGGLLDPLGPARLSPELSDRTRPPWLDCDTVADLDDVRARVGGWTT